MADRTFRLGGYQGPNSVHSRALRILRDRLSETLRPSRPVALEENITARGRKASDLLEMTARGALDLCYFASSYLVPKVPALGVFDQHFRVPDRPRAHAMLDGPLGRRFSDEIAARTGYLALAFWDNGFRHISSAAGRPIRRPKDCAGMKIRTLANEGHRRALEALGFKPHAIDVRDLPEAVASGRVDAQENPLTNIYNFGLHHTHRHVTLTRHLFGVALLLVNGERFGAMTSRERAAVRMAVSEATAAQRRFAAEDDEACAEALEADETEIIALDSCARRAFAFAVSAAVDRTRAQYPEDLVALFDEALDAAGSPGASVVGPKAAASGGRRYDDGR